mgnify:CR=1 FL=1
MKRYRLVRILSLAILLSVPTVAGAQTGGTYDLTWSSIDGGGHTFSTGGDYVLGGTAGQPDAGVMTGGNYTLGGGFWGGGAVESGPTHDIFLPLVLKN